MDLFAPELEAQTPDMEPKTPNMTFQQLDSSQGASRTPKPLIL